MAERAGPAHSSQLTLEEISKYFRYSFQEVRTLLTLPRRKIGASADGFVSNSVFPLFAGCNSSGTVSDDTEESV